MYDVYRYIRVWVCGYIYTVIPALWTVDTLFKNNSINIVCVCYILDFDYMRYTITHTQTANGHPTPTHTHASASVHIHHISPARSQASVRFRYIASLGVSVSSRVGLFPWAVRPMRAVIRRVQVWRINPHSFVRPASLLM